MWPSSRGSIGSILEGQSVVAVYLCTVTSSGCRWTSPPTPLQTKRRVNLLIFHFWKHESCYCSQLGDSTSNFDELTYFWASADIQFSHCCLVITLFIPLGHFSQHGQIGFKTVSLLMQNFLTASSLHINSYIRHLSSPLCAFLLKITMTPAQNRGLRKEKTLYLTRLHEFGKLRNADMAMPLQGWSLFLHTGLPDHQSRPLQN